MTHRQYNKSKIGGTLNMGQLLRAVIAQKSLAKSLIARKMQRKDAGILKFTQQRSMQMSIVWEFCYAMQHNLFADLAQKLPTEFTTLHTPDTSKDEEIAQLKRRIEILEAQLEVLRK